MISILPHRLSDYWGEGRQVHTQPMVGRRGGGAEPMVGGQLMIPYYHSRGLIAVLKPEKGPFINELAPGGGYHSLNTVRKYFILLIFQLLFVKRDCL